uniref:Carotenoid oxygenase n=1 Tax=Pelagomonas calceolata TaxID=35677 RepID=A0A7S4E4S4_9STRA
MRFARVLLLLQACSALLWHQPPRCRRAQPPRVGTSLDDFPAARCTDACKLRTTGTLPKWLAGAVVRNGPGRFTTARQNCSHLFDGMALLSRFEVDGATNSVKWTSRYLRSQAYEYASTNGGLLYNEFGTAAGVGLAGRAVSLMRGVLAGGTTDNACVSVVPTADGRAVCLSEPTRASYAIDPKTLETLGAHSYKGSDLPGLLHTAHPIPYGDGFVNVATALFPVPKYTVYKSDGNFQHPRRICDLAPSQNFPDVSWHHSFAVGGRYAIVIETPCVYNVAALVGVADAAHIAFDWRDNAPTTLRVVDIEKGEEVTKRTLREPCFFFHAANAFVEGTTLHVDVGYYDDASMLNGLALDRMRAAPSTNGATPSRLTRLSIELGSDADVRATRLDGPAAGEFCEFPVVDPRLAGRRHRFVYAVGLKRPGNVGNLLTRTDCETQETIANGFGAVVVGGCGGCLQERRQAAPPSAPGRADGRRARRRRAVAGGRDAGRGSQERAEHG